MNVRTFWFLLFAALPLPAAAAEAIQDLVSPGGIHFWLIEVPANPLISMEFAFEGGTATDPAGKEGRANLVSALLDEGAGDLDSQAFQQAIQERGIQYDFSARTDHFYGSLKTVTQHAEEAADLLSLALSAPRFDAEAVTRMQAAIATSIRRNTGDPSWLGRRAFYERLWGDHPYGRPSRGTMATLSALEEADLRLFVSERFARDQLTVSVVGDVTAQEAGMLVDRAFGALPAEGVPFAPEPTEIQLEPGILQVDWEGAQTALLLAQPGISRDDPRRETAMVLNHVLGGGGFASRLTQQVREERGLTYGISSYLVSFDAGDLLLASSDLSNGNVAEALAVIDQVWTDLAVNGPTEAEVDDAIAYLVGSWPLQMTSTDRLAAILLTMQVNERDTDHLETRLQRLREVTVEDVRDLARDLLQPDGLIVTLVGTPEGVTPDQVIEAQELVERELSDR